MTLDYPSIGKRIKIARIKADLSQERLAEIIDISPTHLSNIERGSTHVSLLTLVKIANALYTSMDELLADNVLYTKPIFENDIQRLLDGCNEYEIRIVKNTLEALVDSLHQNDLLKDNIAPYTVR